MGVATARHPVPDSWSRHSATGALTVVRTFTAVTTTVVERGQKSLGVEQTGTVALGDVVFVPEALRAAYTTTVVGAQAAPVGRSRPCPPAGALVRARAARRRASPSERTRDSHETARTDCTSAAASDKCLRALGHEVPEDGVSKGDGVHIPRSATDDESERSSR